MHTITAERIIGVLLVYAGLFVIIRMLKPEIEKREKKTFLVIGGVWAVSVFIANVLLYRAGLMSLLPWENNFMHTFLWIGFCLTWLYLGVRRTQHMVIQFLVFAMFSLIVKYTEQLLFGTWEHGHFFHVFKGNFAYVLGWSLADGLYPPLTLYGLRMLGKVVKGLDVVKTGEQVPPPEPKTEEELRIEGIGEPTALDRFFTTAFLLFFALWDAALAVVCLGFPETWFEWLHGAQYVDPQALLQRTGAVWAAFSLFHWIALFKWRRRPFWLVVVGGMRLAEIFADWTYLFMASDFTAAGRVAMLLATPSNIIFSWYFIDMFLGIERRAKVKV